MRTMRFEPIDFREDEVPTIFEVDEATNMLEQVIAVRALGAYTLTTIHLLPKGAVIAESSGAAYLARRIGTINSNRSEGLATKSSRKSTAQEVSLPLSSQEAQSLLNALVYYAELTREDLYNIAFLRNYEAASTRLVENNIAHSMAYDLREEFFIEPEPAPTPPPIGFAGALY